MVPKFYLTPILFYFDHLQSSQGHQTLSQSTGYSTFYSSMRFSGSQKTAERIRTWAEVSPSGSHYLLMCN